MRIRPLLWLFAPLAALCLSFSVSSERVNTTVAVQNVTSNDSSLTIEALPYYAANDPFIMKILNLSTSTPRPAKEPASGSSDGGGYSKRRGNKRGKQRNKERGKKRGKK